MRKNVLMPGFEPTDKELRDLMKEVAKDVRMKNQITKDKLKQELIDAIKNLDSLRKD